MTVRRNSGASLELHLGGLEGAVDQRLSIWEREDLPGRIWRKDPSVWSRQPVPELADRLGWLDLPESMIGSLDQFTEIARGVRREGLQAAVLLGMGGSSLAPEVLQRVLGAASGFPSLTVADTTHPAAVASLAERLDVDRTLFLVSSKSGTTLETLALFRYFWARSQQETGEAGHRFIAVTDPDSSLAALGAERGFRQVVLSPPDVGGRYSALSPFGLVPAALLGADSRALLGSAARMARSCSAESGAAGNPALRLGAALGELARAGADKLTLRTSASLESLPDWVEQLVAESTGKDGKGIVPVVGEPPMPATGYGEDRCFVTLALDDDETSELEEWSGALRRAGRPVIAIRLSNRHELGAEFFRWELAVAAAGAVLGIHPFDQPDVQLTKTLTRETMDEGGRAAQRGELPPPVAVGEGNARRALAGWIGQARPGDYLAVLAYLEPSAEAERRLRELQAALARSTGRAVTVGFGPRYLHSTGQIHKGGPNSGLFLQLIDRPASDLAVPETGYGFARLSAAQALGDALALSRRGRRLLRVDLGEHVEAGMDRLAAASSF